MSRQRHLLRHGEHAFNWMQGRRREGLCWTDRRGMLKASLAGLGGLTLPGLLAQRAPGSASTALAQKSVILLWMAGGPSHIDMWDPKPDRPPENRGPFGVTRTKVPSIHICEHLPKQAAMMDQFTLIRSVDARKSNHEPNKVFQTGNRESAPRINPKGEKYPAIGSVVAKHVAVHRPTMPPYVTFTKSRSHIAKAGYLGRSFDPFDGNLAADLPIYDLVGNDTGKRTGAPLFQLPAALSTSRIESRRALLQQLDQMRRYLEASGEMEATDAYQQQAVEMMLGKTAQHAFDLSREPTATRDRYGKHLWCQQALLARRLVEAGVAFVTLDLSYHTASGTWDTHGDNIPPYGGIKKGLGPLLPLFDHLLTTLVSDLKSRGLLDQVLVIAMGEFGRTPLLGTQDSTDGRNHWPHVMSMCLAGGGLQHGQVIGSTESDGGQIRERPVTPGDLAATIYRHMGVSQEATWEDNQGRPHPIVLENGQPLPELFGS